MRKALFLFMVFGLVGLMCGCELETTALSESDISDNYNEEVKKSLRKLILTGNCKECPLMGVGISGKDLSHKDLTGADLKGAKLDGAILCHTTMSDGKKVYSNCKNADLRNADLTGANLEDANLTGAKIKNTRNLDSAIKCKTIFSWGEDNSGC